ncbi:MAG: SGNH/GDSL hydrolase family protein [Clostridiaceae bacterium]|nr:SGNH/GDSL hydrolase family protein [Clostridiaceae bacterium]
MKKTKILQVAAAALVTIIILVFLEKLLMPKYMTQILEGALISEYYQEKEKDHDVIFVGDCEVYESFSPITLWEKFGITSFIRGSAQQLIWHSYYLLEETLRYEKPEVVVFNVLSMKYDVPQKEAYNRMALDDMPMSITKLKAIRASMMEEEKFITYLFPILRYHSRWSELTSEDLKYWLKRERISHNGYLMRVDTKAVTTIPTKKRLPNYEFSEICYHYLDKMTALCKENDIELVLIKAPSLYPHWYDEWDEQMRAYAEENDLYYINFLDYTDEIGIDYSTDTYDGGLHLNLSGAEKMSEYFGRILTEKYNLRDHREDAELKKIWDGKIAFYNQTIEMQFSELELLGYIKAFNKKKEEG